MQAFASVVRCFAKPELAGPRLLAGELPLQNCRAQDASNLLQASGTLAHKGHPLAAPLASQAGALADSLIPQALANRAQRAAMPGLRGLTPPKTPAGRAAKDMGKPTPQAPANTAQPWATLEARRD
ncbi:unnamed protein product [Effrenium voratum]|nr:unnamed protein product [Effrenium voratum]